MNTSLFSTSHRSDTTSKILKNKYETTNGKQRMSELERVARQEAFSSKNYLCVSTSSKLFGLWFCFSLGF